MGFPEVAKNIFLSKDPFFLIFFVTAKCNARCKMCFNWDNVVSWKERNPYELSIEEVEKISKHFSSLQQLTLSGGEPFLRSDLDAICHCFAKNSQVQFITIPTNGVLTTQIKKILPRILEQNPNVHIRLGLSMPEIGLDLDELYGIKNSFERHQETYAFVKTLLPKFKNFNLDVGIVLNKYNLSSVKHIIDYSVKEMPQANPVVSLVRGKPQFADAKEVPVQELDEVYAYIRTNIKKVKNRPYADFMNLMRDMVHEATQKMVKENKMVYSCTAGKKLLVIYDNGDLFPCELLENKKLGNLRDYDYDFRKILALESSQAVVNDIVKKKCFCTWECAINNNIIFSNKARVDLALRYCLYRMGLYRDASQGAQGLSLPEYN